MASWVLQKDKYLTVVEAERLRKVTEGAAIVAVAKGNTQAVKEWMFIDLGLSSGLRVAEIADLKVKDVYVKRGESEIFVRNGKGGKSGRVNISSKLKKHIKEYIHWKQEMGEPVDGESWFFISQRGGQYSTRGLQLMFKNCLRRAGVNERYGPHAMRHTFSIMLYKASGWNLRAVQKELRHSSIKTTQVYADVMDEDLQEAVNKVW